MSARLRILLLEDDPLDVELVLAALRAAGLDFDARVVQTEASFGDALTRFRPDAVVSDYSMPGFSGLAALALCRRGGADLPFIFVSGTIGEDVAVEAMKLGASDYVMKGNLLRLGPAVVREVRDARERHARRVAESGLRRAQAMAKLSHVVSGADGSFQNWSENLPAMLAAGEAEMPKSIWYWLERVHPDDRTRFRRIALEARASGEQRTLEYRLRAGDGRWIHIRQTIEPLAGEQEGPRWFNTLQDVSEEKRAEQALEESEARFRRTFDLAASGMAHVDLEGRLIRVNPKLCAMLGYAADELVGRSVKDLSHPEDRDVTDAGRERMRAAAASDGAFEKRYLRKDGSVIWVSLTVALARDSDGEPEYEIAVLEDITERRNAQARIERLTRVHAVMSGINAAIVRIRDRQKLLEEACRIAVDAGRFPMAYIALVDCERGRLVPAAWNAPTEGFLRAAEERFRLDADNPPARVARDKVPFVANDVEADPRMVLKDEHAQRGVRSVAILPILVADEVAGVLGLHATEPGFFDEAELRLLQELAGDIAFALEHMEKEEKLHYLAYYDELTGLANHALLMERLAQSLRSASHEGREVSLILIDVERFRAVNDSLGRQAGDAVLRQLARRLEDSLGQRDCVARVGGDRFAVFLTAARLGGDAARSHLERMRTCFGEPFRAGEHELRLSARAGIALFPADGGDAETLYRNAEAALASAKSSREPFSFYAQAMNERAAERLSLETRLRRAIDRQEF
ncbi:MAG: PAS domain S-box protein, partial [Betaproteobacteria bacterium]